jgi:hypothetical protein
MTLEILALIGLVVTLCVSGSLIAWHLHNIPIAIILLAICAVDVAVLTAIYNGERNAEEERTEDDGGREEERGSAPTTATEDTNEK